MEYKISKVSGEEPRKWDGPNGTVYYIKVMLEGHDKAVTIGKKSPDALKAGDTVYGEVIASPDYGQDKFKLASKPFAPASGGGGGKYGQKSASEQDSIYRSVALNNAVQLAGPLGNLDDALKSAEAFYGWLKRDDSPVSETNENKEDF